MNTGGTLRVPPLCLGDIHRERGSAPRASYIELFWVGEKNMKRFLIGLSIGYGIGRLIAPEPGDRFRDRITSRVKNALSAIGSSHPDAVSPGTLAYALNEASEEELKSVRGIGAGLARKIIRHRPYQTGLEILDDKVLPDATFERLKEKFGAEATA
ncbi:MAG: hypothetical protein NVS9B15_10340 [Acidobacteriaceae bacterium]